MLLSCGDFSSLRSLEAVECVGWLLGHGHVWFDVREKLHAFLVYWNTKQCHVYLFVGIESNKIKIFHTIGGVSSSHRKQKRTNMLLFDSSS